MAAPRTTPKNSWEREHTIDPTRFNSFVVSYEFDFKVIGDEGGDSPTPDDSITAPAITTAAVAARAADDAGCGSGGASAGSGGVDDAKSNASIPETIKIREELGSYTGWRLLSSFWFFKRLLAGWWLWCFAVVALYLVAARRPR